RLGLVYLHVGFLDDAIDEFQKALAIDPTDRLAEQRIGVALVPQGKYEEALRIFRQIPSDKNHDLWHYHVAWALLHLHQDSSATAPDLDIFRRDPAFFAFLRDLTAEWARYRAPL